MNLTENLNTISTWILGPLARRDLLLDNLKTQLPLMEAERLIAFDKVAVMWSELTDDERHILSTQRPDLVDSFDEAVLRIELKEALDE